MGLRQFVQSVAAAPGVKHEGHEHGVVDGRRMDAASGEHEHVVFYVLPHLHDRRVLEQRLDRGERPVGGNLVSDIAHEGAFGRAVRQRDVDRFPRFDGERKADEFGAGSVEAGGLGVDGDAPGLGCAGDPSFKNVERTHQRIVPLRRRRRRARRPGARIFFGPPVFGADTRQQRAEFVLGEEPAQRFALRRQRAEILQRHGHRGVSVQGHEPAADAREIGVIDEVPPAFGLFDLRRAGEQRIEVAPGVDQRRRGLDPDPRHAGNVIGRIARERLNVDDLFGGNAEFFDHLGGADLAHADGVQHDHALAHQLHEVLVAGGDGHAVAPRRGETDVGGDQVVGLESGEFDRRQPEGARRVAHERELRHERFRRVGPVRLVGGVDVVAERGAGGVEQDGDPAPLLGAGELVDHVAEAEHGVGGRSVPPVQGRQPVKGAENEPRTVDQTDAPLARLAHRPLPSRRRLARALHSMNAPRATPKEAVSGGSGLPASASSFPRMILRRTPPPQRREPGAVFSRGATARRTGCSPMSPRRTRPVARRGSGSPQPRIVLPRSRWRQGRRRQVESRRWGRGRCDRPALPVHGS